MHDAAYIQGYGATHIAGTDQALATLERGTLELEELLPEAMTRNLRLPSLAAALAYIHRPPPDADIGALVMRDHPTQKRLALEELLDYLG